MRYGYFFMGKISKRIDQDVLAMPVQKEVGKKKG